MWVFKFVSFAPIKHGIVSICIFTSDLIMHLNWKRAEEKVWYILSENSYKSKFSSYQGYNRKTVSKSFSLNLKLWQIIVASDYISHLHVILRTKWYFFYTIDVNNIATMIFSPFFVSRFDYHRLFFCISYKRYLLPWLEVTITSTNHSHSVTLSIAFAFMDSIRSQKYFAGF